MENTKGERATLITTDPVTGVFLVAMRGDGKELPRKFYALDAKKDQWTELPYQIPEATWGVAAPVSNYGVVMFCADRPRSVWLYKHKPVLPADEPKAGSDKR